MTKKISRAAEEGEVFSDLHTTGRAGRQGLSVGWGAGFHPPAVMGSF